MPFPGIDWAQKWENVHVNSWRNRTGCMVDFGDDSCILLGIASSLQGGEITHLVPAQGITVLPRLRTGPSAILMVLAFQPLLQICICVWILAVKRLPVSNVTHSNCHLQRRVHLRLTTSFALILWGKPSLPLSVPPVQLYPWMQRQLLYHYWSVCWEERHSHLKMQLLQVLCNITLKPFGKMPFLPVIPTMQRPRRSRWQWWIFEWWRWERRYDFTHNLELLLLLPSHSLLSD